MFDFSAIIGLHWHHRRSSQLATAAAASAKA
jgi:hypothetical protein